MRAIYHPFQREELSHGLFIQDESAKHLQVVRVKIDEEVLVLNGNGMRAITKVASISKNQVELVVLKVEESKPFHQINLAIANPKKDAFEDILKLAVELGVKNIFPLKSDYSQYEYEASPRVERLLESALIQSNNPFMPKVFPQQKLEKFLDETNTPLYFFNSRETECGKLPKISEELTVLIGPEGGFSTREEALIISKTKVISIHLSTPIQRAPTAVASSIGYLLSLV